jgi:hypothetical protein
MGGFTVIGKGDGYMRKLILVSLLSLLLLTGCEKEIDPDPVIQAFKSEGINLTEKALTQVLVLDGTRPKSYKLNPAVFIMIYNFDSKEKQELGYKEFKKQRETKNITDPTVFQANKYLAISYVFEEKLREKIQKALNRLQ